MNGKGLKIEVAILDAFVGLETVSFAHGIQFAEDGLADLGLLAGGGDGLEICLLNWLTEDFAGPWSKEVGRDAEDGNEKGLYRVAVHKSRSD